MIAVHPDGRVVVYDVKTGQESASHVAQVQLYMHLIPRSQDDRWRGKIFEGAVVYKGGREVPVPADSVNEAFVSRPGQVHQEDDLFHAGPQGAESARVSLLRLTKADCPDRIEPDADSDAA